MLWFMGYLTYFVSSLMVDHLNASLFESAIFGGVFKCILQTVMMDS